RRTVSIFPLENFTLIVSPSVTLTTVAVVLDGCSLSSKARAGEVKDRTRARANRTDKAFRKIRHPLALFFLFDECIYIFFPDSPQHRHLDTGKSAKPTPFLNRLWRHPQPFRCFLRRQQSTFILFRFHLTFSPFRGLLLAKSYRQRKYSVKHNQF